MAGTVEVSLDLVWSIIGFVVQAGGFIAALAIWGSKLDTRLKAVESTQSEVKKIATIESNFDRFEKDVERRLEGIEGKVDEVHRLLIRAAARA